MIRFDNVSYTYPRTDVPALAGIDLTIPEGQMCAVVGANGAGKSTFCLTLAGFMPEFYRGQLDGRLTVEGEDVVEKSIAELSGTVGLVFSNPFNQITGARFTVHDEIGFGLENMGVPKDEIEERIAAVMEMTGLTDLADRSPYGLSGGQQQRLAIASVLVMEPQVLVLDEPTSQLDPIGSREVFAVLRELVQRGETTVVLAEHKLEWIAEFADRVLVLEAGRIVADGPPADILASPDLKSWGVEPTRYTQAAAAAREQGLVPGDRSLPVTLDQAIAFFSS